MVKQFGALLSIGALSFCSGTSIQSPLETRKLDEQFNSYWYSGKAEISSYELTQARYGELHKGNAVLVFVTEPFSRDKLVKVDQSSVEDVAVLKCNITKKFNTGVYPYSMMCSVFSPVQLKENALKVTTSSQEWCGHTFSQLERRKDWKFKQFSYFESEGDIEKTITPSWLEDELLNLIRMNPNDLPTGTLSIVPSSFFLRLLHDDFKAIKAEASIQKGDEMSTYSLKYATGRTISYHFKTVFPHEISGWEEEYEDGFGTPVRLKTTAVLKKTIRSPYWNKHSVADSVLRLELGL